MTKTRRWLPATLTGVGTVAVLLLCLNLAGCLDGLPTGHRYALIEVTNNGVAVPMVAGSSAYLRFDFPKVIRGSGGCNEFDGKVDIDDGQLVLHDLTYTDKECSRALLDQDLWFDDFLNSRPRFKLKDDVITLTSDDGRQIKLKKVS